jgi:hypothetical protein
MIPSRSYPVLQVRQATQGQLAVRAGFVGTYIVSAALRTVHARGTRHRAGSVWCASKHGVRCVLRARASYLEIDAALIQYAYLLAVPTCLDSSNTVVHFLLRVLPIAFFL